MAEQGIRYASDGPWSASTLLARTRHGPLPSSIQGARRLERRRGVGLRLGTPVEENHCGPSGMVVEPSPPAVSGAPNDFQGLGTVGERQRPLVTRSGRLAKAKVAG